MIVINHKKRIDFKKIDRGISALLRVTAIGHTEIDVISFNKYFAYTE